MKFLGFVKLSLLVAALGLCAIAFAQDASGASVPAPQDLKALWPMMGTAGATLAAYLLKYMTARYAWFHTAAGSIVIGLLGSVLSTITPLAQTGHLWGAALAWAAMGGVTSFVATLNPSIVQGVATPTVQK